VIAARAEFRDRVLAARPPLQLGDPEQPPPVEALPPAMARATLALMTLLESDVTALVAGNSLTGTGIGTEPYRGRACVVTGTDDALLRLELGDVLVALYTGPDYNSILPILGALVVESGGPLCHAAIVAREFGLSAVVGAAGATIAIPDGALVEVDPVHGAVSIVA
jgi:pyruvate,water dikinase